MGNKLTKAAPPTCAGGAAVYTSFFIIQFEHQVLPRRTPLKMKEISEGQLSLAVGASEEISNYDEKEDKST